MEMDELVAASDVAVDVNCQPESTTTSAANSPTAPAGAAAAAAAATAAPSPTTNTSLGALPTTVVTTDYVSALSKDINVPKLLEEYLSSFSDTSKPSKPFLIESPDDADGGNVSSNVTPANSSTTTSASATATTNTTATTSTTTNSIAAAFFQAGPVADPLDELGAVERLDKYSMSDIVFHRQIATRTLLETLHEVRQNATDLQRVATVINRFADDPEPSIRAELAEQLPQIACFCLNSQNGVPPSMSNITLPILEQFLTDVNSQVRKITQNSLAYMMEQNIVDLQFVEEKISPVLVHLMDITNMDDYRIEAVTTVSKIVRFLGKNVTEKVFLRHFSRLCSDVSFHVRRSCAANFGEICSVVGKQLTESILLCPFRSLCEDDIWGVRKACADVFVPVSCVCSEAVRKYVLAPLFVSLLCDQSKWVKTAAFQTLGPFISTFADPSKTGLYYTEGGLVVVEDAKDHESNSSGSTDSGCSIDSNNSNDECDSEALNGNSNGRSLPSFVNKLSLSELSTCYPGLANSPENMDTSPSLECANGSAGESSTTTDSTCVIVESFNCFNYWRIPLGEFQVDPELSNCIDSSSVKSSTGDENRDNNTSSHNSNNNNDIARDVNSSDDENTSKSISESEEVEEVEEEEVEVEEEEMIKEEDIEEDASQCVASDNATCNMNNSNDSDSHAMENEGLGINFKISDRNRQKRSASTNMMGTTLGTCVALEKLLDSILLRGIQSNKFQVSESAHKELLAKQETVPIELLEHYLNMTSPVSNFENVDHDLSHHCAYSFPAVAMTLGRKHWPCLREAYKLLAKDVQLKVRWTLASSLHQMALILGPEHTSRDLLPIFMSFMKDLEEVRFGVLQNLSSILPFFNRIEQIAILPRIADFLNMENPRNWRFRYTLAEQVMGISSLYCPADIKECLLPIAYTLLKDKVSEVRLSAIRLMSNLLKHFFCDASSVPRMNSASGSSEATTAAFDTSKSSTSSDSKLDQMSIELVSSLVNLFDWWSKWVYRQSFVFLCEQIVADESIPAHIFNQYFIQSLFSLANDRVPNVRLALSRCLARSLFQNANYPHQQPMVISILTKFKSDTDLDVRRFSQSVLSSDSPDSNPLQTTDATSIADADDDDVVDDDLLPPRSAICRNDVGQCESVITNCNVITDVSTLTVD